MFSKSSHFGLETIISDFLLFKGELIIGPTYLYDSIFGDSWYLGNPESGKSFNFISAIKVYLISSSMHLQITLDKVTSSLRYGEAWEEG